LEIEKKYRKFELTDLLKEAKNQVNTYEVDQVAQQHGHQVLRLPPYNCELNPIELVWKDIKHEVRKENYNQNEKEIIQLAKCKLDNYEASRWNTHINHVKR